MKYGEPYMRIQVKAIKFGFMKDFPFTKDGINKLKETIAFIETQLSVSPKVSQEKTK